VQRIGTALVGGALLALLATGTSPAAGPTDEWGHRLYPSQHGAPPGYPGCFDDRWEADQGRAIKKGDPKYPRWGHPELQNYPGSVEHYRTMSQKYLPAFNPFDATSLVKNWRAAALPGGDAARLEEYAEPIYYVPMYGRARFTGRYNAPVQVLRLKPGAEPIRVPIGRLRRGMYVLRIVAAIETKHCAPDPKPLVIRCTINSGPGGAEQTWVRRHRAVDEFYQVGEWYFHAWDDRVFQATLALEPETEVDLLVHNVDLHDALAGCPERVVKKRPTLYDPERRRAARDHYARTNKVDRSWGPNITVPRAKGLWKGRPLAMEQRRARDDVLWNAWPPAMMNAQNAHAYGTYDRATLDDKELAKIGTWQIPFRTRYARNWDRVPVLKNAKLGLTYTLEDLLRARPLPAPYPYKDRGCGVLLKDKGGYFCPILDALGSMVARGQRTIFYMVSGDQTVGYLPLEYYYRNNLQAARDAAFLLCRMAYTQPAVITRMRRSLQQVVCRPAQCWGREPVLRRTFVRYPSAGMMRNLRTYDMLFDFIDGNEELARAVGRFVPWIRNAKDLRAFLDQRLLLLPAREMARHRMGSSHGTPIMAIEIATAIGNREASRPVMDYLFSATWDYPLPVSGIQDYLSTVVTRDGTTTIGSFFYTAGGSPLLRTVAAIDQYIAAGGDPKYNLADFRRFPKPLFGAYFNLDGRVAGLWPLGVGDVGGVFAYGHWFRSQEAPVRAGWRYLRDPRLAYILKNYFGRADENDAEWAAIEKAAATVKRNPWMANRSRVLAAWAGILESGTQHDDYRFRRAVTVRVGVGWGHSHRDTLDLQVFALGCQMTPDGGQRPNYGRPECFTTMNHNLVEVDGDGGRREGNWEGHAWIRTLTDVPGSPMLQAKAIPPLNKQQVRLAERTVALIDVDEGRPATRPPSDPTLRPGTRYDPNVVLPQSYVFDVYRVAGGKRHTYCFHGPPEDLFTVNAQNPRKVPLAAKAEKDDTDAQYLRKYVIEGDQGAGDAPETVVATWRMGRERFTFSTSAGSVDEGQVRTYTCGAPEQTMYGPNYSPDSPRKFMRLHLLDQKGARVLWGRWVSAPYTSRHGQWFTQLHVMRDGDQDRESVFVAVMEPYAGEPFLREVKRLPVPGNETDARRAVAVAVTTTNGHRDVLFADGRPEKRRTLPAAGGLAVSGRYAFLSTDAQGLRQASLVEGRELRVPGRVLLAPATPTYTGKVLRIDHPARTLRLDRRLPTRLLDRSFWDVGNEKHRTSLEVSDVAPDAAGGGSLVRFRKGLELVHTRVKAVDPQRGVVTGKLVSVLMGSEEDNGMKPGMTDGLWATNEDLSKWWRCTYLGGSRADGYEYKLSGGPVSERDFPVGGALRIWELGPGDDMRLAAFVSVRRLPDDPTIYELSANVACTLGLPDPGRGGYSVSTDRKRWTPLRGAVRDGLWTVQLTETRLGDGRLYLRRAGTR